VISGHFSGPVVYYEEEEKNQCCESILLEGQVKIELNLLKELNLPFSKFI
jgi:hypothetical protein